MDKFEVNKEELKKLIFDICSVASVSGFEKRAHSEISRITEGMFDQIKSDAVGNMILIKKCGRANAPKILIDTHLDEIGLMVSDVCEGGFLRVIPLGGIDVSILQGADVIIYGKKALRGVVCSTPPHLKSSEDLPEGHQLLIDTGLSEKSARELIPLGTPIGFPPLYSELLENKIMGKSFDNKACAACAIYTVHNTPKEELCGDVYLLLSSLEETNPLGGAAAGTFAIDPDYAMVIDVNLARVPGTKKYDTVELGQGISISMSAATHRRLTLDTEHLCQERSIPYCRVAAPSSTGTNAICVNLTGLGVPTVDVGLPLASMHTYNEVISLEDAGSLSQLVSAFISSNKICECYARKEEVTV